MTTFSQIELLALDNATGELVDLLDNDSSAKNFSSANTAYGQPDGMRWLHTFSKDTEIRAYKIKGLG